MVAVLKDGQALTAESLYWLLIFGGDPIKPCEMEGFSFIGVTTYCSLHNKLNRMSNIVENTHYFVFIYLRSTL
jgi:hypothetical protein